MSRGISRPGVQILSATVSEQAEHWYVSLLEEELQSVPENTGPVVGIDLGVKHLATKKQELNIKGGVSILG
jgi:transposase